ncbi:hypothetical protein DEO72_LG11g1890 [Vigna unguiculata]|uniref:Uncharacterized protein n=1 Tax=Vigna unguiculata TaxID=3917 RepID=A0A4D6NQD4_VIGUN|nr:hypothetical protein DEO72_LG11g1890 [Vigna unguiculata]
MRSAAVRVFWESAQKPPGGFACAARRYISEKWGFNLVLVCRLAALHQPPGDSGVAGNKSDGVMFKQLAGIGNIWDGYHRAILSCRINCIMCQISRAMSLVRMFRAHVERCHVRGGTGLVDHMCWTTGGQVRRARLRAGSSPFLFVYGDDRVIRYTGADVETGGAEDVQPTE